MVRQRPRRARQTPWQERVTRLVVPSLLAGLATTGIVVAATGSTRAPEITAVPAPVSSVTPVPTGSATPQALLREQRTSRGVTAPRVALPSPEKKKKAAPTKVAEKNTATTSTKKAAATAPSLTVVGRKYTRVDLNVRAAADAGSTLLAVLDSGDRVAVTATVRGPWRYVSYRGRGAWVKNQYLVDTKPKPKPEPKPKPKPKVAAGLSGRACSGGSAVERGLTPDGVRVHRAICARFPSVSAYGGARADSLPEHPSGRALDAMISSSSTGWQIASFVRANAGRLGVSQVLYAQKIWTVQRNSEGWRSFPDRGSVSANHYDHVHVTVYGSSGG